MNSHSPQSRDENKRLVAGTPALKWIMLTLTIAAFLLGACGAPAAAVKTFVKGDQLAYYDFSRAGTFEEGSYSNDNVRLEIREGAYHMDLALGDSVLWYGQWGDTLRDVVLDVDVKQLTDSPNTIYGVMCRARGTIGQISSKPDPELAALANESSNGSLVASAEATLEPKAESTSEATAEATAEVTAEATSESTSEPTPESTPTAEPTPDSLTVNNGDGYLFLIEGTGRFAIMRSSGGATTPLVDWTSSSIIMPGAAQNKIRAVCMGSYLALYINGEFMADASDDSYNQGQIGLVAAAESRLGNSVQFDNLTVSEAKSG